MDLEHLRRVLARHDPRRVALDATRRPAAVLVPFVSRTDGGLDVLFTRRTNDTPAHPGQISFPGGKLEPTDSSAIAAALRETEEELGIPSEHIELLGELDGVVTSSSFAVVPIAGHLPSRPEVRPSPREVAEVLYVPFEVFVTEATMELRDLPTRKGVIFYHHEGASIWGATARIMKQLVDLLRAEPSR